MKQNYSTPGILIFFDIVNCVTYNIIINITTNDNKIFLWDNTQNDKYFLRDGTNTINFTFNKKNIIIGVLMSDPTYDSYFFLNKFDVKYNFSNLMLNFNFNENIFRDVFLKNVFLINLEKRPDRLNKMNVLLNYHNINYTRINAIDGTLLADEFNNIKNTKITSLGAYGNLLTNIEIIKMAKKNNYQYIVIFEDDLIFHKQFNEKLKNISLIPNDWKILYFGSSQRVGTINKIKKNKYYYKAQQSRGTFAIIINHSIFDELIELWESKYENSDMALEHIQNKYNCYVMWENLIIADLSESNIQDSRDNETYATKFGWNLELYLFSPNVTILLPVFNGENYLTECIKSVLEQNYYYFELIIINDCSVDKTTDIINLFDDKRIKIINNEKNMGLPESLNIGLKNTQTKYITWISHDNIFETSAISKMVNYLENNTNCNLVIGGHCKFNVNNVTQYIKPVIYSSMDIIFYFHGVACFMFTKSISDKIGYYDNDLNGVEDWDYFIRILENEPFRNGIIDEQLYKYRCHPEQNTHKINLQDLTFKLCEKIIERNYNFTKNYNLNQYLKKTKNKYIREYFFGFNDSYMFSY